MDGDERIILQSNKLALKKALIFVFFSVIFNSFFSSVNALTIYPGVEFEVENEIYTVNQVMYFSSITISDTYIIFNTTGFYIDAPNDIMISLIFLNSSIIQASNSDLVLQFYADTISGNVLFYISGFLSEYEYEIRIDGNPSFNSIANSSGFISFTNSVWSNHEFSIYQVGIGNDIISPEITDITLTTSIPLDTETEFGWENITCSVIDNVEIDEVKINITYPDSIESNISMNHNTGTDTFYYNTSFSLIGNYNYFIWTRDTSLNGNFSEIFSFSLPPNWDINNDGECKVIDLTMVSNNYNKIGDSGWIREDVDNNGLVNVLDLVLVSNHYDEIW